MNTPNTEALTPPSPISVVIPSTGRESVWRAVLSATRQTPPPAEVVVVFNGPVDEKGDRLGSLQELRGLQLVPIRTLEIPPFSGPSIARNLGAWMAECPILAFLDDDDEFAPGYLQAATRLISEPAVQILYGNKVWRDDHREVRRKSIASVTPADWFGVLFKAENPGFGGTNLVVRRDVFFDLGGFSVAFLSGEDRAFAMAALQAGIRIDPLDADVWCHDPVGPRAKLRSDKWVTNLRIVREYWPYVTWPLRLVAAWRVFRGFVRRPYLSASS